VNKEGEKASYEQYDATFFAGHCPCIRYTCTVAANIVVIFTIFF